MKHIEKIIITIIIILLIPNVTAIQGILYQGLGIDKCREHYIQGVNYGIAMSGFNSLECRPHIDIWKLVESCATDFVPYIDNADREYIGPETGDFTGHTFILQNLPLEFTVIHCNLEENSIKYDIRSHASVCGDGECNGDETCSSCSQDCGQCQTCSYPSKYNCDTADELTKIAYEWINGICTLAQMKACNQTYFNQAKCSYPSKIDCNTNEELQIITSEWQDNICSNQELLNCQSAWTATEETSCSYPSKYDCNTKEEADMIIKEWEEGKCTKAQSQECIVKWSSTEGQSQCSYPSEVDCDTWEEVQTIEKIWRANPSNGVCSGIDFNACLRDYNANKPKCGDNQCNGDETCSTCPSDCSCKSYEKCINGVCRGYCGNGRKDVGETCSSCPQDVKCLPNEECLKGICTNKCGNKRRDSGETCTSCPKDVICPSGMSCVNDKCVGCTSDSQCKEYTKYIGEYFCGENNRIVYELGYKEGGFCRNGQCTGEKSKVKRKARDCGDHFCQEGHCGCLEGYETCPKTGKCEEQFALKENAKCGCDWQCESGYCNKGICLNALDIAFSSTKSELKPGEEATITLSISNNLDKEIKFSGTANIGTGSEMVEIISGDDCSGNQCKIAGNLDEMGRKESTIVVKSHSNKPIPLAATVGYNVDDKELEVHKEDVINEGGLTETTGNVVVDSLSGANPLLGILIILGIIFFGLGILYLTYNLGKGRGLKKKR